MKLSDVIESFILDQLAVSNGIAHIQRNELANRIGCVPSQINYVIQTRFTGQMGYLVESRRGGGGGIIIKQLCSSEGLLSHMIDQIGSELSQQDALVFLSQLQEYQLLSPREYALIKAATSDRSLPEPQPKRNQIRSLLFRKMLLALCTIS